VTRLRAWLIMSVSIFSPLSGVVKIGSRARAQSKPRFEQVNY
jgi:hypothetical protein